MNPRRALSTTRALLVVLAVTAVAVARGADMPKLPADRPLPASEGSPGAVTFRHSSHVDPARPSCAACHPKLFRMLEPAVAADGLPIRHEAMEQGRHCGACHGKAAFNFDRCDACHG